jgi:hypothetical protein
MSSTSQRPGRQAKLQHQRDAPVAGQLVEQFNGTPDAFEEEVRRLAQEMWPQSGGEAPTILYNRERDGVFVTSDTVHIVEATIEKRKAKAEYDIEKSIELKKIMSRDSSYEGYNFKIWFITLNDPTADQASVAVALRKVARCPVVAMSGRTFQDHLVKATDYLHARRCYPFGSIRNLDPSDLARIIHERSGLCDFPAVIQL